VPDFPSYSAVRSVLSILKRKGFLSHNLRGKKYIYSPTITADKVMHSAVKQLLTTFFDDSLEKVVAAMLEIHGDDLTEDDFERLAAIIARAKKEDEKTHDPDDT
jgi:predicted transcriptional regulator